VQVNTVLQELMDSHAPEKTIQVSQRPFAPWYDDNVAESKRQKRRAERRSAKTGLMIDKELYKEACRSYSKTLFQSKSQYMKQEIEQLNNKGLFQFVHRLSTQSSSRTLPKHDSDKKLANDFGMFFYSKVQSIVNKLSSQSMSEEGSTKLQLQARFSEFQTVSEDVVRRAIKQSPSKSCRLDPAPTWLVKTCLDEMLPLITRVINLSLSTGIVPCIFKTSHITPVPKKSLQDPDDLAGYRPIANLMFLSKILEKIVDNQLRAYLREHNLFPAMQAAYRANHSTETALTRVYNDILLAVDKGQEVILVLLDYSSAFDSIDHKKITRCFQQSYGIDGTALSWLTSYLIDRKQIVVVNGTMGDEYPLSWGVPQGSVMGPLYFAMYTGSISNTISAHPGVNHIMYADDTQLYIVLKQNELASGASILEHCITDVKSWSSQNSLLLNGGKTEVIHIASQFRKRNPSPDLIIDGVRITPSTSAKDLGVIVDNAVTMKEHIKKISRAASFGIFKIGKLRQYLDRTSTERLVNALVTSHLDYCNSLLINLPASHLAPLQSIQNTAARLITRSKKFQHITPVLHSLHWLPIPRRTQFKVLLLTYKILRNHEPSYLAELLSSRTRPSINLRSSSSSQFAPGPRTNTRYGDRAFSVCAPTLWNSLPSYIQNAQTIGSFKTQLKTHLFNGFHQCQ
jgi:hypothetical protein